MHASPAEHVATPDSRIQIPRYHPDTGTYTFDEGRWQFQEQHGCFDGYRQYRKMLPGEAIAPLPEGYV
jgi:hypothetical protein